ncbi:MAG: hypothetical protein RLZZ244_98 [Verrucomicrobiota bacterium]
MNVIGENVITQKQSHTIGEDGIGEYSVTFFHTEEPTPPTLDDFPSGGLSGTSSYKLTQASVETTEGGFLMSLTYKGIAVDGRKILTVDGSTNEESIQTHPQFPSWAGTPSNPVWTNAYWEILSEKEEGDSSSSDVKPKKLTYKFNGFKPNAQNNLAGVESWLVPGTVIQTTEVIAGGFTIPQTGVRETPSLPGWSFTGSWLLENVNIERHGGAYRMTKRYRQGGSNGWNQYIYPQA